MMMNKYIVITGSSKGIGRYLVEVFLKRGFIVFGCSRSKSNLNHKNYHHFLTDVSKEEDVKRMTLGIRKTTKKIDYLINNAGMASMNHIITTPKISFDKLIQTNFLGTFLFTREISKFMLKDGGRIVNFSTVASPLNLEGEAVYASSKAAIEKFTKISSFELSKFNINVNCIGPTPVLTDLIKTVPKNKIDELIDKQSIKRLGNFDDVLNIIDFFLDEKSEFISGQVIYLGGITN
tara:strand:- start:3264 stop:3968 length:705 start_codon:yes stop_codon:yes gene_type:complete